MAGDWGGRVVEPGGRVVEADDTSFNRLVLKSALPAVVLFVAGWSEACGPSLASLGGLAARHAGAVRVAVVDVDASPMVAGSFGVQAVPSYVLFRGGEPLAHRLGYLPEALLEGFFQLARTLERPLPAAWEPTEAEIEDSLLLPMLVRWGWGFERQRQCALPGARRARRGVVDILAFHGPSPTPLTLFENKRSIRDELELRRAAQQALAYARSLGLRLFVVADATRLWVFQVHQGEALLVRTLAGPDLEADDTLLRDALLEIDLRLGAG